MGAMRLPQTEPGFAGPIDETRAQALIDECLARGVNYFDTAYVYHGGQSEAFLGKALGSHPRESFYLADKFNVQVNPDYRFQFRIHLNKAGEIALVHAGAYMGIPRLVNALNACKDLLAEQA